jgi:flagellar protein FlaG
MSLDKLTNSGAIKDIRVKVKPKATPAPVQVKVVAEENKVKKPVPDRKHIEMALKNFKSTRFSYILTDEVNRFIVKIIDKNTDKVIKQIPSEELTKLHDNLQEALGILFDQEI